jgi:PAS domain S-box-containing protein
MPKTDPVNKNLIPGALDSAPCGILISDIKGTIVFLNRKAEQILAAKRESLLGRNIAAQIDLFFPEKGFDKVRQARKKILGKTVTLYRAPFRHAEEPFGEICLLFDDSFALLAEPACAPEVEQTIESLIEGFYDGVVLVENDRVVRVNSSYARITGIKEDTMLGAKVDDLDGATHICLHTIQEVVRLAQQVKKSVTSMGQLRHGNEIYVTATPVQTRSGIRYILVNVRDVTELQLLKEEVSRLMALYLSTPEEVRISQILGQEIVTENRVMRGILDLIARLAQVDSTVFFEGESGTGKEVLARLTHRLSSRRKGPFISVNCGAIPETLFESELFGYVRGAFTGAVNEGKPGLFELSDDGVLFLDEVSEIPLNCQVKLLKVLESMEVMRVGGVKTTRLNVRIIAATNRSLTQMVKEGKFREDLYYRLYVVPIKIPPLRERPEDIFPLAWHFLRICNNKFKQSKRLSREVIQAMECYHWPGNVRELQNVIERITLTSDGEDLRPEHLPLSIYQPLAGEHSVVKINGILPLEKAREIVERQLISQALALRGTTREAARLLGVNHSTVVRKVKRYGIQAGTAEPPGEPGGTS